MNDRTIIGIDTAKSSFALHGEDTFGTTVFRKTSSRTLLLAFQALLASPGVYAFRTNVLKQDADWLWNTYIRLTEIEAVFRVLKSEVGLRPIVHQKSLRAKGHLFVSVIACQAVHLIRAGSRLLASGTAGTS